MTTKHPRTTTPTIMAIRDEDETSLLVHMAQTGMLLHQDLGAVIDVKYDKVNGSWSTHRSHSTPSHRDVLGHDPASCDGDERDMTHLYTQDFIDHTLPRLVHAFVHGDSASGSTGEYELKHADGTLIPFRWQIAVANASRIYIIWRDMSDLHTRQHLEKTTKLLRAQVENEKSRLLHALTSGYDLVAEFQVADGVAERIYSSESHRTVLGHVPETCNGVVTALTHLYTADFRMTEAPKLIAAIEAKKLPDGFIGETRMLHADGHALWFEWRASFCKSPDPTKPRMIVISRDITDRKERQRLEVENARLEMARQKDEEAVHFMAHQLKNRFVAVRQLMETMRLTLEEQAPLLLDVCAPHNVAECISDGIRQVDRGVRLCMNESVARQMAHGRYTQRPVEFDLLAEMRKIGGDRVCVHVEHDVPRRIVLDLDLLVHVLDNYISNAIKYGALHAEVNIHIRHVSYHLLHIDVVNAVRTTVDAMSSGQCGGDYVERTPRTTSLGRGLDIARRCASLLNATTVLDVSACGETHASITVPYEMHDAVSALTTHTLIASLDDDALVRMADLACFRVMGVAPESEALIRGATVDEIEGFVETVVTHAPDVVLLDQNLDDPVTFMPFRRGVDLVRELRARAFTGCVLVRSANLTTADRDLYHTAGADGSIAKGLSIIDASRAIAIALHDSQWRRRHEHSKDDDNNGHVAVASTDSTVLVLSHTTSIFYTLDDPLQLPRLADVLRKSIGTALREARAALRRADLAATLRIVHRIKGSALQAGGMRLVEPCMYAKDATAPPQLEKRLADIAEAGDEMMCAIDALILERTTRVAPP